MKTANLHLTWGICHDLGSSFIYIYTYLLCAYIYIHIFTVCIFIYIYTYLLCAYIYIHMFYSFMPNLIYPQNPETPPETPQKRGQFWGPIWPPLLYTAPRSSDSTPICLEQPMVGRKSLITCYSCLVSPFQIGYLSGSSNTGVNDMTALLNGVNGVRMIVHVWLLSVLLSLGQSQAASKPTPKPKARRQQPRQQEKTQHGSSFTQTLNGAGVLTYILPPLTTPKCRYS